MKHVRLFVLVLASVGCAGVMLLWSVTMKRELDGRVQRERLVRVEAVRELLDAQAAQTLWAARQVAVVAAADPRPRAALSIEPVDAATLQDAVDEVQRDARLDWLGLCSNNGRLLAGAGPPSLKAMVGVELKDASLFQAAGAEESPSSLWFTAHGPMVVTASPVMRGSSRAGVVLVGRRLEQNAFERAASIAGGAVGLGGPRGEWAGSTAAAPSEAAAIRSPARLWPGVALVVSAPGAALPGGLWVPLVTVAVMGLASLLLLSSLQVPRAKQ